MRTEPMDNMHFSFTDTLAGYVTAFDEGVNSFGLRTCDGREYNVKIAPACYSEFVRNLDEDFQGAEANTGTLVPGRLVHVLGAFYPEKEYHVEALHILFPGRAPDQYCFEAPDWWVSQVRSLANFYMKAQFEGGPVDYGKYRTKLYLNGAKLGDNRQEIDTLSRLVYGFATAYLMTGEESYLEAAEAGTLYLRTHCMEVDSRRDVTYWHHAVDIVGGRREKILASQFDDDNGTIPAYEQIYALAGPAQTYRITGDPGTLRDIEGTVRLFNTCYLDTSRHGGYFSHIDPKTFSTMDVEERNRARKNWNSVGDHAPAYLINLWLATGRPEYAAMLESVFDTITARFPDYDHSVFVQEKFFADWKPDQAWGWQRNRAVVGHNLKIAWNLMRMNSLKPKDGYVALAERIAALMPATGADLQRGGWYDVVERLRGEAGAYHRFVWHDRKAWWQQEQGILAYLILAGCLGKEEYLRIARESSAFYNAYFLDHDDGGVYCNVLADGMPYLIGPYRLKGSHSMSGYHSFELCYLAAVYTNLLVRKEPMNLYFKPRPDGFAGRLLRVAPDILPKGSVRIDRVEVCGTPHRDWDAQGLTVQLPETRESLPVKVRLVPAR
ncbi:MAG: AGE family epimerase/isomerase [Candidatus Latescibacterota bacterium]